MCELVCACVKYVKSQGSFSFYGFVFDGNTALCSQSQPHTPSYPTFSFSLSHYLLFAGQRVKCLLLLVSVAIDTQVEIKVEHVINTLDVRHLSSTRARTYRRGG